MDIDIFRSKGLSPYVYFSVTQSLALNFHFQLTFLPQAILLGWQYLFAIFHFKINGPEQLLHLLACDIDNFVEIWKIQFGIPLKFLFTYLEPALD